MPDWNELIKANLPLPEMTGLREERIIGELSDHLEEHYRRLRAEGKSDSEAVGMVLERMGDWREFVDELLEEEYRHERPKVGVALERVEQTARRRGGFAAAAADTWQDVCHALRILRRNPGFSLTAVATLMLGIGGVIIIFSLINAVLIRPLPFPDSDRLVLMLESTPGGGAMTMSYVNYLDWREENRSFADIGCWNQTEFNLTGQGVPTVVSAVPVTASMFGILGIEPRLGRTFTEAEDRVGGDPVTVLTWGFWQNRLGGNEEVIGSTLTLDGIPNTVIGVMPPTFAFPPEAEAPDLFVPIGQAAPYLGGRTSHPGIFAIGRLSDGVTFEQARADMERVTNAMAAEYPDELEEHGAYLRDLKEFVARRADDPLLQLLAAVGLLLIIACSNVATLLLAQTTSRQSEIALRATLGAGRGRLIRLLLVRSVTLWLAGGILGIVLAAAAVRAAAPLWADLLPRAFSVAIDARAVVVALLLALVTGLLFGLAPALLTAFHDPASILRSGPGPAGGVRRRRLQKTLIVAEVGLAVALLAGTGQMIRSLNRLTGADLGLEPAGVLAGEISLPPMRYQEESTQLAFFSELRERIGALPGIEAAATCRTLPLSGHGWQNGYYIEGEPEPAPGEANWTEANAISADYFAVMSIVLLRGRVISEEDVTDARSVAVVDELFASLHWPDSDPIGRRFSFSFPPSEENLFEIVGVVRHVHARGPIDETRPEVYLPRPAAGTGGGYLVVKSDLLPRQVTDAIREQVQALDPDQPVREIVRLSELARATTRQSRFVTLLLVFFASAALLLTSIGIYGVVSYLTAERRYEIGVRIALGAHRGHVIATVIGQGLRTVLIGGGVGVALAILFGLLLRSQLFAIAAVSPLTVIGAAILMGAVATVAIWIPARRSARVDPSTVLKTM